MNGRRTNHLRKFILEEILANIRRKGSEKGFELLEISTDEGLIRIPLRKINSLAFIEE